LEVLVVIAIVTLLMGLLLTSIQKVRLAAYRLACLSNLKQIGLALQTYHDQSRVLPPGVIPPVQVGPGVAPFPLLHWQARLLPFIEQDALWRQILEVYAQDPTAMGNGLDAPSSQKIPVYTCPAETERPGTFFANLQYTPAPTSYLGVVGTNHVRQDGCLFVNSFIGLSLITDGTSETVIVGERPHNPDLRLGEWLGAHGYWNIGNAVLGVRETEVRDSTWGCPNGPYDFAPGDYNDPCAAFHFWSAHPGGANFLFADGSGRFLTYTARSILPALSTRAGGEIVDATSF
jgi:prepilin-type processing-associated H-X9-DG protein